MTYAKRQTQALEKAPQRSKCVACRDLIPYHETVHAQCKEKFGCSHYIACLKYYFMRSTKDETLYPPACHGHEIDVQLISPIISTEEPEMFHGGRSSSPRQTELTAAIRSVGSSFPDSNC
jgi:hypothetical protein